VAKVKCQKLVDECTKFLEKINVKISAPELWLQIENLTDNEVPRLICSHLEKTGLLEQAGAAYEGTNVWNALIRLLLKVNLNQVKVIVRECIMADDCRMVAEHYIRLGNYSYAIVFINKSCRSDDTFKICCPHMKLDVLSDLIGQSGTKGQFEEHPNYFQAENGLVLAGIFFEKTELGEKSFNFDDIFRNRHFHLKLFKDSIQIKLNESSEIKNDHSETLTL
jgi:hypothetical protein